MEFVFGTVVIVFVSALLWFSIRWDRSERAFRRELAARLTIDSNEFIAFYSTPVERAIAFRLLPIYADFFGIDPGKLRPADRPPEIVELDTVELVLDIEAEFNISIPDRDAEGINGSFDSLVQYLARNCPSECETAT
jgi:hypothetical protein